MVIKKVDLYYLHLLAINEIIALALQWCLRPIWPLLLSIDPGPLLKGRSTLLILADLRAPYSLRGTFGRRWVARSLLRSLE